MRSLRPVAKGGSAALTKSWGRPTFSRLGRLARSSSSLSWPWLSTTPTRV